MKKILSSLNTISNYFDSIGQEKYANDIHNVFMKLADKFNPEYKVTFPKNLNDALDDFNSNYEVDSEGDWEETDPIDEFRDELDDSDLHSPAAVDDNHIIFENPKNKHIEVMNMVPKQHLDSLHKNDDR